MLVQQKSLVLMLGNVHPEINKKKSTHRIVVLVIFVCPLFVSRVLPSIVTHSNRRMTPSAFAVLKTFPIENSGRELVYMEGIGFLFHNWADSYIDGWIAVELMFNQIGIDATNIKLMEGPLWISIRDLGKVVGKVKAEIIGFQASCGDDITDYRIDSYGSAAMAKHISSKKIYCC